MLETLRMLWYYESSENPKTMQTISRKEQESCKEECTSAQSKVEILGWIAEVLRVASESSSSRHCESRSQYLWTGRPSPLPSKIAQELLAPSLQLSCYPQRLYAELDPLN